MAQAQLAADIDIGGGTHALFHQTDRLDHQRMEQAIDGEADPRP